MCSHSMEKSWALSIIKWRSIWSKFVRYVWGWECVRVWDVVPILSKSLCNNTNSNVSISFCICCGFNRQSRTDAEMKLIKCIKKSKCSREINRKKLLEKIFWWQKLLLVQMIYVLKAFYQRDDYAMESTWRNRFAMQSLLVFCLYMYTVAVKEWNKLTHVSDVRGGRTQEMTFFLRKSSEKLK